VGQWSGGQVGNRCATVLLVAVGVGAAFGIGASIRDEVYETSVDVELAPTSPRSLYDPVAATWTPDEALAHELAFYGGDRVQRALDAELVYPHELDVEAIGPTTLRFRTRAPTPELAVAAASASGAVYGAVREEHARTEADAIVQGQTALVAELQAATAAGDAEAQAALPEATERLQLARDGRATLEQLTAYVVAPPHEPCCPAGPHPVLATLVGLALGAGLGWGLVRATAVVAAGSAGGGSAGGGSDVLLAAERVLGAGPEPARSAWRRWVTTAVEDPRAPFVVLGLLVLGRFVVHALQGTNLVLDDLTLSYYAERGGFWEVVPSGQDLHLARPGAWLTFTLLYGLVGAHPLVLFVVVTLLNLLVAWLLLLVLRRIVADRTALWVAALWVVLPTHTTLTVWAGTTQVVVGLVLLLAGALAFQHGRWVVAGLGLAASILCYELAVPAALLVPLVAGSGLLPLRVDRRDPHPVGWQVRGIAFVPVAMAAAWSLTHSIYDVAPHRPGLVEIWTAHVGIGLFGSYETPDWLVVAFGAVVAGGAASCVVAWVLGERGRQEGPSMVVAGLLLVGVGLPVAFTLGVMPLGLEDRVYGISTIGSALLLVGMGTWLWRRSRTVATVGGVLLLAACLVGQVVAMRSWSRAGDDVVALLRYADDRPESEATHLHVVPGPLNRNGVVGTLSPTGGANEAFLLRHPGADPDGPGVGEPATGSVTIADGSGAPPPEGSVVVPWTQVLAHQPEG